MNVKQVKVGDEPLVSNIVGSKGYYSRQNFNISPVANCIDSFKIEFSSPIPSRNNRFGNAYIATSVSHNNNYYAFVFNRNVPIRMHEIASLTGSHLQHIIIPVAYGITEISHLDNCEHFVVIMPILQLKSLADILDEKKVFDEDFILDGMLPAILATLNHLHKNNIVHGKLNIDNVFINTHNNTVYLGECYLESMGFSQNILFDTIERAQSLPFGRAEGNEKIDYYALGILLFTISTGKILKTSNKDVVLEKLKLSTYGFLCDNYYMTGRLADIIKGLVSDDQCKRWSSLQIESVLRNQSYSFDDFDDQSVLSRAIIFGDKEFYSPRALAYEMSQNWDIAKEFIVGDKLKRWLSSSAPHAKMVTLIDGMKSMMSSARMLNQKYFQDDDELLIRILIVLDPFGPLRFYSVVFLKDSIKTMVLGSIIDGQNEVLQVIIGTMMSSLYDVYDRLSSAYNNMMLAYGLSDIKKGIKILSRTDISGGLDRFIYEFINVMPCQDVLLKKRLCFNDADLLLILEEENIAFDEIISKKPILSFLVARAQDANIDGLLKGINNVPELYKSKIFQIGSYIALSQYYNRIEAIPNLTSSFILEMKRLLSSFMHSKKLRNEMMEKIDEAANTNSLINVIRVAASGALIANDVSGYQSVKIEAAAILQEVDFYRSNRKSLNASIYHKSLSAAVNVSYIILIAICFKMLLI